MMWSSATFQCTKTAMWPCTKMPVCRPTCLNLPTCPSTPPLAGMTCITPLWRQSRSSVSQVGQSGTSLNCFVDKTWPLTIEHWERSWWTRPRRGSRFGSWSGRKRRPIRSIPKVSWVPMTWTLTTTSRILASIAAWHQGKTTFF